jgi:cytochrome c oxidase subunit I
MNTAAIPARLTAVWETPHTLWGELTTVDHKKLGMRYIVTAFAFLLAGGIEALWMRVQLAAPELHVLNPEAYDQFFTMHGSTMIYWYAGPVLSGFSVYLIPLMIGARDMAFPRANAFSYWTYLFSGVFLYVSLLVNEAPHAGWFAYAPYTLRQYSPGPNMDFWALALIFFAISQTVGAINFLVTIFRHRAPGMSLNRMPLLAYSTSTVSGLSILSMPTLVIGCVFMLLERSWGFHFYEPARGGTPILWQHLFWFFAHPWVYIIFLPATGMISMILPVFARRPIVGYTYVAVATVLTGVVGLGVWVHHMFATGMPGMSATYFAAASMTISIFSTVQVFAWLATMWSGKPVLRSPMLFALGFLATFIIGGLNGTITALIPFDWQLTDSYWVPAHIHYVIIAANVFPVFAGLYYWLPKMTGRMMNERWALVSFALMFIGFNVGFFPMHILGLLGMERRLYTYPPGLGWEGWNLAISVGSYVFAVGVLVSLVNFLLSVRRGPHAGPNPWNADTLEWSVSSPPAPYGSVHIPIIESRHPLWDAHDEEHDPEGARILDQGRLTLSTTWLDARTVAVAQMPEDTIVPLVFALVMGGFFAALLLHALAWAAVAIGVQVILTAVWLWPTHAKMAA